LAILGSKRGKDNNMAGPEEKGQGFTIVCNDCGGGNVYVRADAALDFEPLGVLIWCLKCQQKCKVG